MIPVGVLAAAGGLGLSMLAPASADSRLTPMTADQLLAAVSTAHVDGFSGTVAENANLGLPAFIAAAGDSMLGLASGSHLLRVWYAGSTQQRVALVDKSGELDVFHNGTDVWQWDSSEQEATHTVGSGPSTPTGTTDPQQLAATVLAAAGTETAISSGQPQKVAGRWAYQLIMTPKQSGTRISSVTMSVDGETHMPLGVQIYGPSKSAGPAVDVSYLDVDFTVPDTSMFTFTPPQSATVIERATSTPSGTKTLGSGWTSVLELPSATAGPAVAASKFLQAVQGGWGSGRLLDTSLICALVTADGRVLAGAVDPSVLYEAAAAN